MPWEHYIGRLCQEFGCRPSQILKELALMPAGMLDRIVDYRSYAAAKAAVDLDPKAQGGLCQLVKELEFELVAEDRDDG